MLNNYTSVAYALDMAENFVWNFHSLSPEVKHTHSAHCPFYNTREEATRYCRLLAISSPNSSVVYFQLSHSDVSYFFFSLPLRITLIISLHLMHVILFIWCLDSVSYKSKFPFWLLLQIKWIFSTETQILISH